MVGKIGQDNFGSADVLASLLYLGLARWSEKLIKFNQNDPKLDIKMGTIGKNR